MLAIEAIENIQKIKEKLYYILIFFLFANFYVS